MNYILKINRTNLKIFLLFIPHIVLYVTLFMLSMSTAKDRLEYLKLFGNPYVNDRYEYLYGKLAHLFYSFGLNPQVSLCIIQLILLLLLYYVFINNIKDKKNVLTSIASFIFFTVFSNSFGIQIRMGLAIVVLVYIYFHIVKGELSRFLFLFIPPLIHYGTIPFIMFALVSLLKPKVKPYTMIFLLAFCFFAISMFLKVLPRILNIGDYYMGYFNGVMPQGRIISFTFLYYVFICFINFYFDKKKYLINWLEYIGIIFFACSIILNVSVLQKMALPFVMMSSISFFNHIRIFLRSDAMSFIIFYLLSFFSFIYYALIVGL